MCGIAGFSHLKNVKRYQRWALVETLTHGIDRRGGHASGYIVMNKSDKGHQLPHQVNRTLGTFGDAPLAFLGKPSVADVAVFHARYATMGAKELVTNAHPFTIKRNGKTILHGVHNGMLSGTWTSAKLNGRGHTVDSRELFELLADKDLTAIQELDGYGLLNWTVPGEDTVYLSKLSEHADLSVCTLKNGGTIWASTKTIVENAISEAGLSNKGNEFWNVADVGQVYIITRDGIFRTEQSGVKLADKPSYRRTTGSPNYTGTLTGYDWEGDDDGNWYKRRWTGKSWVWNPDLKRLESPEDIEAREDKEALARAKVVLDRFDANLAEREAEREAIVVEAQLVDDSEAQPGNHAYTERADGTADMVTVSGVRWHRPSKNAHWVRTPGDPVVTVKVDDVSEEEAIMLLGDGFGC